MSLYVIKTSRREDTLEITSGFHPVIPVGLGAAGFFIIFLMGLTGLIPVKMPLENFDKPMGPAGCIPVFFFFLAVTIFSFHNQVTIQKDLITLKTRIFFFFNTTVKIPVEKSGGILLKSGKGNTYSLFILDSDRPAHTLLRGKAEKIRDIAQEISSLTGLPITESVPEPVEADETPEPEEK